MGTDSGLQHRYIDTDVTNGRTYYYAVVAIDKGYQPSFYPSLSDRQGLLEIPPTPCSADIQVDLLGRAIATDKNTVIVTPVERSAGWIAPLVEGWRRVTCVRVRYRIDRRSTSTIGPGSFRAASTRSRSPTTARFTRYYANGITNAFILKNITTNSFYRTSPGPDTSTKTGEILAEGFKVTIKNSAIRIDTTNTAMDDRQVNASRIGARPMPSSPCRETTNS